MFNTILKEQIKKFAISEGAGMVGIAPVQIYHDYYGEVEGRIKDTGATMTDFMIPANEQNFFDRISYAKNTLPTATSIIMLGVYAYDETAVYRNTYQELRGKTARIYSYYPVIRHIAEKLTAFLRNLGYNAMHGQNVPLKYVADRIGLGCYGKNGILMTKEYGSYIALRNVLTDAPLEPDEFTRTSFCQDCDLCLKACPTGALYAPYRVNPRLCLNPISRREDYISPEIRSKMQNWISGCDICQEVCPANRHLIPRESDVRSGFEPEHHASHRNLGGLEKTPRLLDILGAGYPFIIRRNASIALANIARGKEVAVESLKSQMESAGGELKDYFSWAMQKIIGYNTS